MKYNLKNKKRENRNEIFDGLKTIAGGDNKM